MSTPVYSKINHLSHLPGSDEVEVSIIGTGFGESIIIHFGMDEWVVIDSCKTNESHVSAPLEYLSAIGTNYQNSVKVILATHWDDDHIDGLSELVEGCSNADICISGVLRDKKFDKIVLDSPIQRAAELTPHIPLGISEFNRIYRYCKKSGRTIRRVIRDQKIWQSALTGAEFITLSPHENICEKAIEQLFDMIPTGNKPVTKISGSKPNHTAVAAAALIAGSHILLGADLEETAQHNGWSLVVEESSYRNQINADIFKVPHHGSENGHSLKVWTYLLAQSPICLISPYNKNPKLPKSSDIARIKNHSPALLVSCPNDVSAAKSKIKNIRRALQSKGANQLYSDFNMVRLRKSFTRKFWQVELFGKAYCA